MASRQTILVALTLPVVVGLLPGLALNALGLQSVSGDASIAIIAGLIAALYAGLSTGLVLALGTGLAAAGSVPAATSPILAGVLMVAVAAGMGYAARLGRNTSVAMGPITIAFLMAEPPAATSWWAVGAVIGICVAYGALLGHVAGRRIKVPAPDEISMSRAAAYAAVLGVLMAVGAWFVVDLRMGHAGAWMLMTILLVVQPYLQDSWNRSLQRALGTVVGFAVAMAIGLLVPYSWLLYALAAVGLILGMRDRLAGASYWRFTSGLTVGIVLLEGAATSVVSTAEQRLFATLAGVGASLLATMVMGPVYRLYARRAGVDHY